MAAIGGAEGRTPGRDNSVSPPRHNLLTSAFWISSPADAESVHSANTLQFNMLGLIIDPGHHLLLLERELNPHPVAFLPSFNVSGVS